jgi:hypothetical protein
MSPSRCTLFLFASFLACSAASAQQPAPTNAQAVLLLQKALAQLSGPRPIEDVTLTGTVRRIAGSDDETGPAVLKAIAVGASRLELNLPSGQRREVRNASGGSPAGAPAGAWSGPDGVSHKIAFHNLVSEPAWFFPAHAIARALSASGYAVNYVGHETKDSVAVEHIAIFQKSAGSSNAEILLQHLSQVDIWLDSSTLLPAAITFNIHPDNNALLDIPVEVRFSDYRRVSGAQIPFHLQKFVNNGLVLNLQFESAVVNSGLPATTFTIGAAGGPTFCANVVAGLQSGAPSCHANVEVGL